MNASNLFAPVNLAEAAYLSGLSRRDIDRVIGERIVPDAMIASGSVRMIAAAACALARFYFETAATLTAATRRRIVADLGERMLALRTNAAGKPVDLARLTFNEGVIHVEFAGFLTEAGNEPDYDFHGQLPKRPQPTLSRIAATLPRSTPRYFLEGRVAPVVAGRWDPLRASRPVPSRNPGHG